MGFIIGVIIGMAGGLVLDYQAYTNKYEGKTHRSVSGKAARGFATIAVIVGLFMMTNWLYNI